MVVILVISLSLIALGCAVFFLGVMQLTGLALVLGAAACLIAVALGVWMLALLPERSRNFKHINGDQFFPLSPDGFPVCGSEPVQRVAVLLGRQLAGSPFHVLTSPNCLRVEWNTGLIQYRSLLVTQHQLKRLFRTTLFLSGSTFVRTDQDQEWDASTGLLRLSAGAANSEGRSVRVERRMELSLGPDGVTKSVDYAIDTRLIDRAIKQVMSQTGFKVKGDVATRIGMVTAAASMVIVGLTLGAIASAGGFNK